MRCKIANISIASVWFKLANHICKFMPQVVSASFPYPKNSWIYIFQLSALKFQNLEFATANSRVCKFSILVKVICISLHTQLPYCQSFTIHENSIGRLSLAVNLTQLSIFTSFNPLPMIRKYAIGNERQTPISIWQTGGVVLGNSTQYLYYSIFTSCPFLLGRPILAKRRNALIIELMLDSTLLLATAFATACPWHSHKITQAPDGFEQEAKKLTKDPLYEIFARDFKCILWRPDIISAYFERINN